MKAEIDANGGDLNDTMTSHTVGAGFGLHPVNAPWTFAMRYVYGFDKDKNAAKGLMDWKNEYKSHYAQADFCWKARRFLGRLTRTIFGTSAAMPRADQS